MIHFRLPSALLLAGLMTFLLLFVMQLMIRMTPPADRGEKRLRLVPFVKLEQDSPVERRREPPPKPFKPSTAPDTQLPPSDATTPIAPFTTSLSVPRLIGPVGSNVFADGDVIAVRQVAPIYPERARERGIEGYVIIEFTVTSAGTTEDVQVVESSHPLLEAAAIKAARKGRYRPRIVDGQAVAVHGMRNRFTFQLEN